VEKNQRKLRPIAERVEKQLKTPAENHNKPAPPDDVDVDVGRGRGVGRASGRHRRGAPEEKRDRGSGEQVSTGEQKQRAQVKIRTYMCVKTAWRDKCAKMECLTNLRTCPSRDRAQKGGDCKRGANNRQWQPAVATPFGQQTNRATVQTIRLNLNNVGHSIYTRFTIAVAITRAITMSNMIN